MSSEYSDRPNWNYSQPDVELWPNSTCQAVADLIGLGTRTKVDTLVAFPMDFSRCTRSELAQMLVNKYQPTIHLSHICAMRSYWRAPC
jgi:hypothetical protein